MKPLGVVGAPTISSFSTSNSLFLPKRLQNHRFCVSCTSPGSRTVEHAKSASSVQEYKPGIFDYLFLNLFRNKLVAVKFGVLPPQLEDDSILIEPCLEACPHAAKRRVVARNINEVPCPSI